MRFTPCRLQSIGLMSFVLGVAALGAAGSSHGAEAAAPGAPVVKAATAPSTSAPAKSAAAGDPANDIRLDYREVTLPNGLHVITLEDFSCPIVNVQVWYHVGSKDEQPERQGFAHLFEHMMFRGTERLGPTEHFDLIRQAGGHCNAYTSFDQTVYHETLAANQLELALWLEADRMSGLKIDQSSFDTERKVVEEERRVGINRPFGTLFENVMAEIYKKHPYRWTPIGKIPHLRASGVAELRDFWTRYYVPNNATLVVAGAVKHDEAQQLARRHFGWIPRGPDVPRVDVKEPWPASKQTVTINEAIAPAPIVGVIFRTVPLRDPDHVPLSLLARILVGDDSSRLYRALVVEKKLAVEAIDISEALEQDGLFFAGAVLPPLPGKASAAMAAMEEEIEKLRTGPISEHELVKAKNRALKETVTRMLTIEGKASTLGQAAVLEGDPARANSVLDDIRRVTLEDLHRVANKYLVPDHQVNVDIPPSGMLGALAGVAKTNAEEDAPITAKPELKAPPPGRAGVTRPQSVYNSPPLSTASAVEPPPLVHTTHKLENGLKVFVIPNHEVPFVSVSLSLMSGAWNEEKPGSASMTLDMITKGTKQHDEAELADELGTYAISLSGNGGMDSSSVSANCVTEQVDRMMRLLGEVVRDPNFPEEPFADVLQQTLTGLKIQANEPTYIADRALRQHVYGKHPYARSSSGEAADVEALKLDDLQEWWRANARPDNAVLIFAGDIDDERALALAKSTFGGWSAPGEAPHPTLPTPPSAAPTHIYLIDQPGATQSQIRFGQLGITRRDAEYPTCRVVDGYFGGSFSSRLNETIRVKRGLTYGAGGGFHPRRFAGDFNVHTFSKTETTAEAVTAVFEELNRLRSEPPTADEINKTKSYLVNNFPLDRETPQQMAGELWLLELNDLPENYFEQELIDIARTDDKACMKLVTGHVHPDEMAVVVVGNAKELKEGLEKVAPVTLVEATE